MTKKIIALLCILSALLALLSGCGSAEVIAPAENTYSKTLYSFSTYEQSPDVLIDGVLDDEVWQGKGWFRNTFLANYTASMPIIEVTGFPTQYGVYIASVVYDQNLTSDGERYPGKNSNWELYLSACNVGEDLFSDENNASWSVNRIYVDMYGSVNSNYTNIDRAVVVDGELNSGMTTKATLEMLVPWAVLDVDTSLGIPEFFGILPCYRAVLQSGGSTSWMAPVDGSISNTTAAYLFDATGFTAADAEGAVLGDGYYGYAKSRGWDLSRIESGIVESTRGGTDKIFFTQQFDNNFIVEATVIPVSGIKSTTPKAGITFLKPDGSSHAVLLSADGDGSLVSSVNGTKNFADYQLVTIDKNYTQTTLSDYDTANENATRQEGVKLTVIKYGSHFWYFADGKFLTEEELVAMDGNCMPGLYSVSMDAIFTDYSCQAIDFEQLTQYLNTKGIYTVQASVDGAGGTVSVDRTSLQSGGNYTLRFNTNSGYRLSSVLLNGTQLLPSIRSKANGGTYTVKKVSSNQSITVTFESCEEVSYSGTVTSDGIGVPATLILENTQDRSLYYEIAGGSVFDLKVPAGTYELAVVAETYKGLGKTLKLTESMTEDLTIEKSDFVSSVTVNGKNLASDMDYYDLSLEYDGKVYGSRELGTRGHSLFMDGSGSDFVAQVTMKYTSDFSAGGSFQSDVLAGFSIHDGSSSFAVWARENGIVTTSGSWKYTMGIFPKKVLTYPEAQTAVFAIAKLGEDFYVYLDGKQVYSAKWVELTSAIPADSDVAIALSMWQDKTCEIEYSNYSVLYDTEAVKAFIDAH